MKSKAKIPHKVRIDYKHNYLAHTGDTAFYGKGKKIILGQKGVSNCFGIGIVEFNKPEKNIRLEIEKLQRQITHDKYLNSIKSVKKRIDEGQFYFHACDDPPEIRMLFYKFIKKLDLDFKFVISHKVLKIFRNIYIKNEINFYADLLSQLFSSDFDRDINIILNFSNRGNSQDTSSIKMGLSYAKRLFEYYHKDFEVKTKYCLNIVNNKQEPLLSVVDYLCWAMSRVYEKGDKRYYDYLKKYKPSLIIEMYDKNNDYKNKYFSNYKYL